MVKKISMTLTSIFLIILSYQIFHEDIDQLPEDGGINSYLVNEELVKEENKLIERDGKPKEKVFSKEKIKKKTVSKKSRKAISKDNKEKSIFNQNDEYFDKSKYKFSNKKNEDWENELRNRLLDSLDNKPQLIIKKEKSLIRILKDKARYIEQAQIIIDHENGRQDSFRAFIDSESGRIIRSWDRTIHENFLERPRKFSPSGQL